MSTTANAGDSSNAASAGADDTILKLNKELQSAILSYVSEGVTIRFDIPDEDHTSKPTVSIFLYDISENLQIRSGIVPMFDPPITNATAGSADQVVTPATNVTCRYLFTYWEQRASPEPTGQYAGPSNQSITTMNQILLAILAHRHFTTIEVSQSRVIPAMDLQSLGTFWQALQSRPRLCLGYEITVPIICRVGNIYPIVLAPSANQIETLRGSNS